MLDLEPVSSRKILQAMQSMEKNTIENVTRFESELDKLESKFRGMVVDVANGCLQTMSKKVTGLEGRIKGVDTQFKDLQQTTKETIASLDKLADQVDATFEQAFGKVCELLDGAILDKLSALGYYAKGKKAEDETAATGEAPTRGRAEAFATEQRRVMARSRSASRDTIREVIREAQGVAAMRDSQFNI